MSKKKQPAGPTDLVRLERIKRLVVIAMFSDDELMDRLVLKGGNAMDLVHGATMRSSVDIDFSMRDDFPPGERDEVRRRVERTLKATFLDAGYEAFDVKMEERPDRLSPELAGFWGGYLVEFKLIERAKFERFSTDVQALRRNAMMLGKSGKFSIDISRFEYTDGKEQLNFDGYRVFVYSPAMIVCEKLRAICQQMPEYGPIVRRGRAGSARARDFLDIHTLVTKRGVDVSMVANRVLLAAMFGAKRVPLPFLRLIHNYREFHRADFPAVQATVKVGVTLENFDLYFNYVLGLVGRLEPFGDV